MELLLIFYLVGGIIFGGASWGIAKVAGWSVSPGLRRIMIGIAYTLPMLLFFGWVRSGLWLDPKSPLLLMYLAPLLVPSGVGAYFGSTKRTLDPRPSNEAT